MSELEENIMKNLMDRYGYYQCMIKRADINGDIYTRREYEAKLSLVQDLIKEIETNNGVLCEFYVDALKKMIKEYNEGEYKL